MISCRHYHYPPPSSNIPSYNDVFIPPRLYFLHFWGSIWKISCLLWAAEQSRDKVRVRSHNYQLGGKCKPRWEQLQLRAGGAASNINISQSCQSSLCFSLLSSLSSVMKVGNISLFNLQYSFMNNSTSENYLISSNKRFDLITFLWNLLRLR